MLDRAPLPADASIRDFQQESAGYVAEVVEQALLLPSDIADLRSMRKHEVFLSLKRDLAMVSPLPSNILLSFFILYNILSFSSFLLFNHASFLDRWFKRHIKPRRW